MERVKVSFMIDVDLLERFNALVPKEKRDDAMNEALAMYVAKIEKQKYATV